MVTFKIVQCHPRLTYILDFWHSGTLVDSPECQCRPNQFDTSAL